MANTEYKSKALQGLDPAKPVMGGVAANTVMRWPPVAAAMRAQDTVPATSRRHLAEYGLDGSSRWHVPDGSDDPGTAADPVAAQVYPDGVTWRTVATGQGRLTPGCMLEGHVLFVPAGLTQKIVPAVGGDIWGSAGAHGDVRVGVTWTSEDGLSTTGPHYFGLSMEGSTQGAFGGGENTDGGADWLTIDERLIEAIRPPTFTTDPDVAVAYSEWAEVEITIELRGSPRIAHMIVYETPLLHVTEHDNAGSVSVHAMPDGGSPLTPRPMVKAPDGTSFDENRFGTTRMVNVLARQGERLGPRILQVSAWDESEPNIWDQTEASPIEVTSTSLVDIYDASITTWSQDNPGWIIGGSHAKLHRLCDPNMIMRGEAAVVPVRLWLDAAKSGAGTATVRVRSGAYEWVDITVASGARALYTITGYLEAQVHADHAWALCQVMALVASAGTLSIYNLSGEFGLW